MHVSPLQDDWDEHLDAAEFAVNSAYQESICNTPFTLNFGSNPATPASMAAGVHKVPASSDFVKVLHADLERARDTFRRAQQRQKAYVDRHRRTAVEFSVGNQILLNSTNIQFKSPGTRKLMPKWIGPFTVSERIGLVDYRLELPPNFRVHNTFHVCLLKQFRADGRFQPPPLPVIIDDFPEYEVESILGHRTRGSGARMKFDYLVKWLNYGPEHNTFEPAEHLTNAQETVDNYWVMLKANGVDKPIGTAKPRKPRVRLPPPPPLTAASALPQVQPPLALTLPIGGRKRGRPPKSQKPPIRSMRARTA
jgi:hypothetical protein